MCITSNSNTVFPCKICNTNIEDTDSAAQCDICQFWIHTKSVRVNNSILRRHSKQHRCNILGGAIKGLTVGSYYSFIFFSLQARRTFCNKNFFHQIVTEVKEKGTVVICNFSTVVISIKDH